jgi:uncharacterized protein YyaL (SSP411 family)
MAHESFEDDATASVMNNLFVNIKVDREERPDVDAVYMDAVQALTGRGGWPMTVFLTPTGEPFYGGTYYPRETFVKLMEAVDDAWRNRRDELQQNVDALVETIGRTAVIPPADDIDAPALISSTVDTLRKNFDATWGGFGGAPKFPSTFSLDLLLRIYSVNKDASLLPMVRTSLDAMAAGGMYDHLGGGFSRYSVDNQWLVPHFEKMLYDQALLVRVYLHQWQLTHESRDEQVVREIVDYIARDLMHSSGGFYSAEDADSLDEHGHSEEGAFYTWTPEEVRHAVTVDTEEVLAYWDITAEGNFEGRSIPNRIRQRGDLIRPSSIVRAQEEMLAVRSLRHRPGLDNKVLTEWNAMMLASLCEVAAAFNDTKYTAMARANAQFLVDNLRLPDGTWRRSWQSDATPAARHNALAHDLAHVVDAMTRMYELTSEHEWLDVANDTAAQLISGHWDAEHGGLFTVAAHAEQLVVRQKDLMDNATPSANSVSAMAFLRLSALTGDETLREHAHDILRLLARVAPNAPSAFGNALAAALLLHVGTTEVVIPGDTPELLSVYREEWRPHGVVAWGDATDSPLWKGRTAGAAYVCRDYVCLLPAQNADEMRQRLVTTENGE